MRNTKYAKELATGIVKADSSNELRVERLHIKDKDRAEIRWSWWKDGGLTPRPLDLTEAQLLELMTAGIAKGVFTTDFLVGLRNRIDSHLATL